MKIPSAATKTWWSQREKEIVKKKKDTVVIKKDICTPTFIAALFTISRTWKQPRCSSIDEWIREMWYIYTMEYYAAMKE